MNNRKLLLSLGAALAMFATACDADKLTDANNNPNDPTDAPSSALFTNATRLAAARWLDGVGGTRYGFLAQHFAQVQYPDDDQYLAARLGASATSGLFNGSYNSELADLKIVMDRGVAATRPGEWAPASILSHWEYGILTDVFGDVPYTEALDATVLKPAYDPQATIYTGIFTELNAASDALGGATNFLGNGDPIFAGDPASWRRFANSLRLRHAMRLLNVAGEAARVNTEVTAAVAAAEGGLILTNAQNARVVWPGNGIYDNPWANNFKTRDDHRVSTRFIRMMRDNADPRVAVLAMPAETVIPEDPARTMNYCPVVGTCYVGLVNALTQATASPLIPNTSRPGAIFYPGVTAYGTFGGPGVAYPSYFMTAAEVEFLLAEAAERGIGGVTGAATHYVNGITRHMEMLGIAPAAIATYLAQPGVAYNVAGTTAQRQIQIAQQKWVALYTDQIQAWSEVRRTCQPFFVEPGPNARFSVIPRRLQYSTTENAVNSAQKAIAVERQWGATGTDVMTNPVYWDNRTAAPTFQAGCSDRSS